MRHCNPVTMDHIIELRKRVALLEKPLDGQTWKKHSEQIKDYAIKELGWKAPE